MSKEQTDLKRAEKWTFALTVVSLIAGGTVVAGLVDRWSSSPSDDISVAGTSSISITSTPEEISPEDVPEFSYVTPSAVYPTAIPGCESVEAPEEDSFFSYILDGSDTYDDPRFPWFSSVKAAAMSEAVKQALPKDVELKFASRVIRCSSGRSLHLRTQMGCPRVSRSRSWRPPLRRGR